MWRRRGRPGHDWLGVEKSEHLEETGIYRKGALRVGRILFGLAERWLLDV